MINLDQLRQQIKKQLIIEGLSVNAFAKKVDMHQPTLYRFLTGKNAPTIKNLNKILKGLSSFNKAA